MCEDRRFLTSFMHSLCCVRNKIMYVLAWRAMIYVLTRVLFWCLFPSLLCNLGNQNSPLVSAQIVRHSGTNIILYEFSFFLWQINNICFQCMLLWWLKFKPFQSHSCRKWQKFENRIFYYSAFNCQRFTIFTFKCMFWKMIIMYRLQIAYLSLKVSTSKMAANRGPMILFTNVLLLHYQLSWANYYCH